MGYQNQPLASHPLSPWPIGKNHLPVLSDTLLQSEDILNMSSDDPLKTGVADDGEVQQFVNPPENLPEEKPDIDTVPNTRDVSNLETNSLLHRRMGNRHLSLDVGLAQNAPRVRSRAYITPAVRFHESLMHVSSVDDPIQPVVDGTSVHAPIETSTTMPRGIPQLVLSTTSSQQHLNVVGGYPAATPLSPDLTPMTPSHALIGSAAFITTDSDIPQTAAARDLVSVFALHHGEYSSITDNIDVSCFHNVSPPRSPAPSSIHADQEFSPGSTRKRTESICSKVSFCFLKIWICLQT